MVGQGTAVLRDKKIGEKIGVVGSLGNGFNISEDFENAFLLGGGIGVAPLLFLANRLIDKNITLSVFCGFRTAKEIPISDYFSDFSPKISTDDGSAYFSGFVTELLEDHLGGKNLDSTVLYACGPKAMMKSVAKIAEEYSIPCQLSLEERMACGVGSCLGCVVETKSGYQRVCVEGPVFSSKEVLL